MPVTLSIRDTPDELAEQVRDRAKRNHRSVRGELLAILEEAIGKQPSRLTPHEVLERAKQLGLSTSSSVEMIRKTRDERYGG
jgi:plasmid stability protein